MKKFEVGKVYSNFWRQCFENGTEIPLGVPMIRVMKRAGNRLYCVMVNSLGRAHSPFKDYYVIKIKGDREMIDDGLTTFYASCGVERYSECVKRVLANRCA